MNPPGDVHYLFLKCDERCQGTLMMYIQRFGRPTCIKLEFLDI